MSIGASCSSCSVLLLLMFSQARLTRADASFDSSQATIDVLGDSYNGWIVRKCKLVDVKLEGVDVHGQDDDAELRPRKGKARSTVTMDLEVEQGMCNNSGNMHGGCTAFLLDVWVAKVSLPGTHLRVRDGMLTIESRLLLSTLV